MDSIAELSQKYSFGFAELVYRGYKRRILTSIYKTFSNYPDVVLEVVSKTISPLVDQTYEIIKDPICEKLIFTKEDARREFVFVGFDPKIIIKLLSENPFGIITHKDYENGSFLPREEGDEKGKEEDGEGGGKEEEDEDEEGKEDEKVKEDKEGKEDEKVKEDEEGKEDEKDEDEEGEEDEDEDEEGEEDEEDEEGEDQDEEVEEDEEEEEDGDYIEYYESDEEFVSDSEESEGEEEDSDKEDQINDKTKKRCINGVLPILKDGETFKVYMYAMKNVGFLLSPDKDAPIIDYDNEESSIIIETNEGGIEFDIDGKLDTLELRIAPTFVVIKVFDKDGETIDHCYEDVKSTVFEVLYTSDEE